jgi:hypothetical protein
MKDLNAHSNNLWVLREINKSFQSYIRDRRRKKWTVIVEYINIEL